MRETRHLFQFIGFMIYGSIICFLVIGLLALVVILGVLYLAALLGNLLWRWMQNSGNKPITP